MSYLDFIWTDEILSHLAEHESCPALEKSHPNLLENLRRDREKIAAELPELLERRKRLDEAAAESSLTGHLRDAIHRSGKSLKRIAAEAGIDTFLLCDFLEGTHTLRSDVLDRLAQAVGAAIRIEPEMAQARGPAD